MSTVRSGASSTRNGVTRAADDAVSIRDVSGDFATIGLWGPRARDLVVAAGASAADVADDAIPMRQMRSIAIGVTPFEAGLGAFVRFDAGPFVGRDSLSDASGRRSDRRLRTLVIGGQDYEPIYGGEAVRLNGDVIGRL